MEKQPLVSIIIPVYNGSNYIKEAIDSAINQTYSNIEIIVVNDGSNDNGATAKIVKKYGNKVKYFEKANGGVSTALNFAISKMTGEYFSWLSHDDRYYKNKIQSQIDYLKNYNDKTILYSDYDLMDENSNIFAVSKKNHEELIQKPEYSLLRGSIDGITLLIPKTAFDECGLFNEKLRCTQDYEMWRRMMSKYKFIHQPEVLATTRLHKNQTTNTSPVMLSEGNELWISLIESFSDTKKKELEFSVYNYYLEMLKFMKTTPYDGTIDF
jgi:glycosyltransferase involved in cell wall biosynthesis